MEGQNASVATLPKPCVPAFEFGRISDTGIKLGGDSAENLAKASSLWVAFEDDEDETRSIKMYVNLETGERVE